MREAVIVASSRTGLAKAFRGSFNMTRPEELAAHCVKDVLRKTPQLDPKEIEDVVLGCGQPQECKAITLLGCRGAAGGLASFNRGHHRESILFLRTAGDCDDGTPDY